ncbi:M14 family metallopeptidase [Algihabitans albus]|uniref:M14 family metallopeptidase n=1 Tax=Algihabitans albus TaxID=2164067 RepID=UPI000E5DA437|nr:M14 family metallopeptidase [Algihabitans albus]
MTDPASYFARSYAEARSRFRDAAKSAGVALDSVAHPRQGPEGEALATDVAWIGPRDAERLLISISATHGIEGYCGSGVQGGSLEAGRYRDLPPGVAVLIVHAINPHGFAWSRRVTEDNVDLNRNFADFDAPLPDNPGYEALHDVICPSAWDPETIERTFAELMGYAEAHSMAALQQAISGGQYVHADGLFYGGRGPTWSHGTLDTLLRSHCGQARKIVVIDYHTGLGPFGYGERICPEAPGTAGHARALDWFDDITSPSDGSSSSAPLVGTNNYGIQRALAHAEVTQIVLEYGTQPLLEVINSLRGDNWLHVHHDPIGPAAQPIKAEIRRCFYPDTPDWCRSVWDRAVETENMALSALAES